MAGLSDTILKEEHLAKRANNLQMNFFLEETKFNFSMVKESDTDSVYIFYKFSSITI